MMAKLFRKTFLVVGIPFLSMLMVGQSALAETIITEALVSEIPEEEKKDMKGAAGGMGDMGGMY